MRWNIKPIPNSTKIKNLAEELKIDTFIAQILVQRGIETFDDARQFFRPALSDIHDPYLMTDMDKAVTRIEKLFKTMKIFLFLATMM